MDSKLRIKLALLFFLICILIGVSSSQIRIDGAKLEKDVKPGDILEHKMVVSNTMSMESVTPLNIKVDVKNMGQANDGGLIPLEDDNIEVAYSAKDYIKLSEDSFELDPGWEENIIAEIRVPETFVDGSRYALIRVYLENNPNENVTLIYGILVPIYLTNNNTELIKSGEISNINVTWPNSTLAFRNTGNTHLRPTIASTLLGSTGKELKSLETTLPNPILPGHEVIYESIFDLPEDLNHGDYTIRFKALLEDGTLLDQKIAKFDV